MDFRPKNYRSRQWEYAESHPSVCKRNPQVDCDLGGAVCACDDGTDDIIYVIYIFKNYKWQYNRETKISNNFFASGFFHRANFLNINSGVQTLPRSVHEMAPMRALSVLQNSPKIVQMTQNDLLTRD